MNIDDRLARQDPARGLDPEPPADLLAQITAVPREATPRRRSAPPRRVVVAAGLAIACAVLVAVSLSGGSHAPGPDLAAQAFAQTDTRLGVLHVRIRTVNEVVLHPGPTSRFRAEHTSNAATEDIWLHGQRARMVARSGRFFNETALAADGTLRGRNGQGDHYAEGPGHGGAVMAKRRSDLLTNFITRFRDRYQRHALAQRGTTTFAGKRARTYVEVHHYRLRAFPKNHLPAGREVERTTYYLDATTGTPLGSVDRTDVHSDDGTVQIQTVTNTVERLENRPATAQTLAQLDFTG